MKTTVDYYINGNGLTYCEDCKEKLSPQDIEDTAYCSEEFEVDREPICDACNATILGTKKYISSYEYTQTDIRDFTRRVTESFRELDDSLYLLQECFYSFDLDKAEYAVIAAPLEGIRNEAKALRVKFSAQCKTVGKTDFWNSNLLNL